MAISRAQIKKELLPGLNGLFGLEYKQYGSEYRNYFDVESSSKAFEEETKLSGFGLVPTKSEGAAIMYDEAQETYTARYTHEAIAMGFALTQEAIEDGLYDNLGRRYTKALARAVAHTEEVKGAAILNSGFDANTKYGDGVSLFSTSHPLLYGGVNANRPSVGADLNETSLEAAFTTIGAWRDERGLLIAARPRKLVVPPALVFTASRLLDTHLRPGTSDNDVNALRSVSVIPEGYVTGHWLTDPSAWFIKTDITNGLKRFNRVALKQSMDEDFDTGNMRYKVRMRFSYGVTDPLGMYGSPGTA